MSIVNLIKNKVLKYFLYSIIVILVVFIFVTLFKWSTLLEEIKPIYSTFKQILTYPVFSVFSRELSLLNILLFIILILLWFSIWKYYQKFIYSFKARNKNISYWTVTILANFWYYLIVILFIFTSLKIIWIDLSNLTMIVSALSVGIWFWLQTIVSNLISWVILMFEQSIKKWDYIELSTDLKWTVTDINMRSTTIRTNNNVIIVVPNQSFIQNNIINYTHWDKKIRIQVPFSVAYWTPYETVEELILWALEKSDIDYMKKADYIPTIFMVAMWPSSVDLMLNVWIKWDDTNNHLFKKGSLLKLVYKTLNENKINIPFPQMDLHIKDSIPLNINLLKNQK